MNERIVSEPPVNYWHDCDRQIAVSNHYDRAAARALNSEWFLINLEPFGQVPRDC